MAERICAFCEKPLTENAKYKYHMDCFDEEIEKHFGMNAQFLMISHQDHDWTHNHNFCRICRSDNWLNSAIKNGVEQGMRHFSRWKLFVAMCRKGWSDEQIWNSLLEFNNNCSPPELKDIFEYHVRYMLKHIGEKDE